MRTNALVINLVSTGIILNRPTNRWPCIDHCWSCRFWVVTSRVSSFPGLLIYFLLPIFSSSFLSCACASAFCLKPKSIKTFTNTKTQLTAPADRSKVTKTAELADSWARVNLTGRDQMSHGMLHEWPLVRDIQSVTRNKREFFWTTSGDVNIIYFFKYNTKWS